MVIKCYQPARDGVVKTSYTRYSQFKQSVLLVGHFRSRFDRPAVEGQS
jgi:hypothetical protein